MGRAVLYHIIHNFKIPNLLLSYSFHFYLNFRNFFSRGFILNFLEIKNIIRFHKPNIFYAPE